MLCREPTVGRQRWKPIDPLADGYNNPGKEENRPKVCNDRSGESSSRLGFVFKEGRQEIKKKKKDILEPMWKDREGICMYELKFKGECEQGLER